ncbi:MAG: PIG-L family deacetylase [Deltaproteobacteria bacterium]|nr:PIG-L family deacetylase [Deltaproteobacteria bacterium]
MKDLSREPAAAATQHKKLKGLSQRDFAASEAMSSTPMTPSSADPDDVSSAWMLAREGRPAFVFAHQDDETVLAGLMHRIVGDGQRGTFIWWTNGDGLAPAVGADPSAYASIRVAEATESLRALGADPAHKVDLWSSEIENYRKMTEVALPKRSKVALDYFRAEAGRLDAAIRRADPDRVFVLAWQGGHPEHDLVHLMTARTVRQLRRETGRPIPIIQAPAYEYVILCALRFKPWFRGDVRRFALSEEERAAKQRVFEAYPSQAALFEKFRWVIRGAGALSALRGKPFGTEVYLGTEQLGVVDPRQDYTASSHRLEALNYIRDDFEGTPIRFDTMIRPVAAALLAG